MTEIKGDLGDEGWRVATLREGFEAVMSEISRGIVRSGGRQGGKRRAPAGGEKPQKAQKAQEGMGLARPFCRGLKEAVPKHTGCPHETGDFRHAGYPNRLGLGLGLGFETASEAARQSLGGKAQPCWASTGVGSLRSVCRLRPAGLPGDQRSTRSSCLPSPANAGLSCARLCRAASARGRTAVKRVRWLS